MGVDVVEHDIPKVFCWKFYKILAIARFTVTSHDESRNRLLRLLSKTDKLAAIFVAFTL